MNQKKEQIKEVSFLVKLGCLFCIIPLIISCVFLTITSLCCLFGVCTNMIPDEIKELGTVLLSSTIVIITISCYVLTHVYIRIFQGKASNTVRIIFGIMALLSYLLPGLFILLGRYEDKAMT
ncbi:hypothetical protein [Candidatus Phytoplasma sp. AldY-WA1]|uniref:hypothetical protein n=1 Tax=Candidatus Phytoplasma sp. AldY-WA1 TaxID=2852100 RepID=UPI00254C4B38|nr:hypothetical protein [Candidatus Phytoplasma sp. AldY-WA1]